ncbi:TcaA NTF2-like domain-containing protein [Alteribacter natronophilus]|uniref:TcaA NTF2-like domain-containing protein n=1 Tax=Alteribacter natronophilus TaxID=2583810 RepID=UPI00110E9066|nr:hypothetical protein [Alteribacter natronophilus]TMW73550.1 hypothetical protein FGB90_04430 [Alteribacter natronophilus]
MGKKVFWIAAAVLCLLAVTACEDVEWYEADETLAAEATDFITEFKHAWTDSLESSSFREVESYLYPNSQFYHMKRRTHQEFVTQRVVEETDEIRVQAVEETEDGEVRITVSEVISRTAGDTGTEERTRTYYLLPFRDTFRITQMERQDSA